MSTQTQKKSLKDRAKEFDGSLPFMEGREKGDTSELIGTVNTIDNYGFLSGDNDKEYVAFTVKERAGKFYFGGEVLTDRMIQLEAEGYREDIEREGLPVLMTQKKSKNGRNYTNIEFYPE